ncbi:hypothetical protein HH310_14000 [Actinoplanes sp. TBRC 11911]|uniref:hypothetical protein n=1 Tax=Actinoplanes sp. TBRC 11911 TaxID=2729386 RepID=UPI00145FB866|nr:hypothetical protein [Actinoplanes sp. TBRC 11911]NMO52306.1 hypothetical protein [Actinoplanes sp. TBRC 11911]
MMVLFDAAVPVHYGFIFLSGDEDQPDLIDARAGQRNGLCGANAAGVLSMVTGLHTGRVPFVVEWHDTEPVLGDEWEDVVEVPFQPAQPDLFLSSFQHFFPVRLPTVTAVRARYCATAMDAARKADTVLAEQATIDRYLLALWPAAPAPDAIVRLTSEAAQSWHHVAQTRRRRPAAVEPPPVEEAVETYDNVAAWGGRPPSERLRGLGGNVRGVARNHRDLLDVFESWDADVQRDAARWLARRAFEVAGLDRLDWARAALDALDRGLPLPTPFTSPQDVFKLVRPGGKKIGVVEVSAGAATPARPIHRPSFAVPAIFSAADPDPLQALVDTFRHAEATFNEQSAELLTELRQRYR